LSKNKKIIELELYRKYINKLLLKKDKEYSLLIMDAIIE